MKTLTEKRFFEWHDDDVAVTLRNRGGHTGTEARYSLSAIPRHHRNTLCHRLQMGATRTSNARQVNHMREAIGIDFYNQCTTRGVSMSLRATRGDNEHIPCVMVIGVIDDDPTPKIGGVEPHTHLTAEIIKE